MKAEQIVPIERLVADIRITFPKVMVERRHGIARRSPGRELEWMICAPECDVEMPDGNPIFSHFAEEGDEYTADGWHRAFEAWLAFRGWYLERHDESWFPPAQLPTDEERAQWAAESLAYQVATQGPPLPAHLDCPF